jgi:hypothetical protein
VVPGPSRILRFSTPSVELQQGLTFRLRVFLEDAAGNTTTGHAQIALTSHGTGKVTGLATAKAANGVATVFVTGTGVGTVWIQATSPGLTPDKTKFVVFKGSN